MTFRIEYTLNAQAEIEEAYLWIKERAVVAAEKWRAELIERIEALGANPHRHPLAPESRRFPREIRQMLFRKRRGQFRVFCTFDKKRVVILSVRRTARKPVDEDDLPR